MSLMATDNEERIYLEERRNQILTLLQKKQRASVAELSQVFRIGEATIRRDLSDLEARGLVQRTHGGVITMENVAIESPVRERAKQNHEYKQRIARFITDYVHDNETLIIDAGSTTWEIARMLRGKKGLSVLTNSPYVAEELVSGHDCQVILTGGELKEPTRAMVGPVAEYTVRQFRADRAILGMSALKSDEGFFTVNYQEAEVKRTMIKNAKEVIIAMDSSKIGKVLHSFVCDLSSIDKLATDDRITLEEKKKIEEQGVEVMVL